MKAWILLSILMLVLNFFVSPGTAADRNSKLFRDILAESELFVRFRFGENEQDILCAVNRGMGKDSVGLLLLEPSGFLKSLVIERKSLAIVHKKLSIPRKDLRGELARQGVPVSMARLVARRIVARRITGAKGSENK